MRFALPIVLALATGCATSGSSGAGAISAPQEATEKAGSPRQTVEAFAAAVEAGRYEEAFGLLSARWRGRLTPERLASDLASSGSLGRDRLVRARLAAGSSAPTLEDGTAAFPLGEGRAVRLLREGDAWRLDALE